MFYSLMSVRLCHRTVHSEQVSSQLIADIWDPIPLQRTPQSWALLLPWQRGSGSTGHPGGSGRGLEAGVHEDTPVVLGISVGGVWVRGRVGQERPRVRFDGSREFARVPSGSTELCDQILCFDMNMERKC